MQAGKKRGDLAERRQRRIPGRDMDQLRRDHVAAEVRRGEASRLIWTMVGSGQ
jgi:hypothetical protein